MYCLKCKKDTKYLNIKAFMSNNNRYMLKSTCNICKGKKSKFVSKKEKTPAILTIWARDLFLYIRQYNSLMNTSSQSSHRGFHQIINGRDMR